MFSGLTIGKAKKLIVDALTNGFAIYIHRTSWSRQMKVIGF